MRLIQGLSERCSCQIKHFQKKYQEVTNTIESPISTSGAALNSVKRGTKFSPGLAKIKTRSRSGLQAATASAMHPPKDSPTRYIGLFGDP